MKLQLPIVPTSFLAECIEKRIIGDMDPFKDYNKYVEPEQQKPTQQITVPSKGSFLLDVDSLIL